MKSSPAPLSIASVATLRREMVENKEHQMRRPSRRAAGVIRKLNISRASCGLQHLSDEVSEVCYLSTVLENRGSTISHCADNDEHFVILFYYLR